MKRERITKLAALPAAGAVATGATAASAWTPAAAPAPVDVEQAAPLAAQADGGTYESCSAYFGLGKDVGVLDVVAFEVTDENGSDGVDHAVPDDTQVVIVLTSDTGETVSCVPVEITEEAWAEAMEQVRVSPPEGQSLPAWPGSGHYAYPTVSFAPAIEGFGTVVDTRFAVTGIPDGHTLVRPADDGEPLSRAAVAPLVQHFPFDPDADGWFVADPRVFAYVADQTSEQVAAAFAQAIAACDDGQTEPDWDAAADGVNAIREYRGYGSIPAEDMGCDGTGIAYAESSILLGLDATVTYVEPIVLALPDETTTTTSTSTTSTVPSSPSAPPADPVEAAARFTG